METKPGAIKLKRKLHSILTAYTRTHSQTHTRDETRTRQEDNAGDGGRDASPQDFQGATRGLFGGGALVGRAFDAGHDHLGLEQRAVVVKERWWRENGRGVRS